MADHYAQSVELLDEADALQAELEQTGFSRRDVVADLNRRHRSALKRAEIHAHLAVAQATFENRLAR